MYYTAKGADMLELLKDILWDRAAGRRALRLILNFFGTGLTALGASSTLPPMWVAAGAAINGISCLVGNDKADPPPRSTAMDKPPAM